MHREGSPDRGGERLSHRERQSSDISVWRTVRALEAGLARYNLMYKLHFIAGMGND